ncbi:MAG: hypothetical protein AB7I50_04320 [Vicinamibacterales bacterium]
MWRWPARWGAPKIREKLRQQARFDAFLEQYNRERPHQALDMKVPADLYSRSPRVYRGLQDRTYPDHDHTIAVTRCGGICFKGRKVLSARCLPDRTPAPPRRTTTSGS